MRHLHSLRDFIACLRELGEIQEVDHPVDWNLEIGAIIRRSYDLRAPAPLFNKIEGIEPGFRVLGAPAGVSRKPGLFLCRIAVSLGLSPTASAREIVDALARAHERAPIPPRRLSTGPCQQNILQGDAVDLYRFPAPLIHAGDGGRYINTWGTIIAQSPDKSWCNWSISRVMIHDKSTMVGLVAPRQHIGVLHAQWKAIGKPMPFALALGTEPAIPFVSGMPLPHGVSEAAYLGGFVGEAIDVVRGVSVDLDIPATSEIVIEGTVSPTETGLEGPMGEYAGYIALGKSSQQPLFHVSAITFRDAPILPVVASGEPIEEDHTCWGLGVSSNVLADLRKHGFPVSTVFAPLESALHWLVITVDPAYRGRFTGEQLIQRVKEIVFASKAGRVVSKVILLDDDVDPSDIDEVVWAFATRCHPEKGQVLFPNEPTPPLPVFLRAEERRTGISTKVVYNCLAPDGAPEQERLHRVSFRHGWPKEIQDKVLASWRRYGYE